MSKQFEYYIDCDERGDFAADVRDQYGNTVWSTSGFDIFEDGWMKDKNDVASLTEYLRGINVIGHKDIVVEGY